MRPLQPEEPRRRAVPDLSRVLEAEYLGTDEPDQSPGDPLQGEDHSGAGDSSRGDSDDRDAPDTVVMAAGSAVPAVRRVDCFA